MLKDKLVGVSVVTEWPLQATPGANSIAGTHRKSSETAVRSRKRNLAKITKNDTKKFMWIDRYSTHGS